MSGARSRRESGTAGGTVHRSDSPGRAVRAPASAPGPLLPRGPLARLVHAGNRAVSTLLTVARQEDGVAGPEPVGPAPRLDAPGIADARRYYTSQPWRYTATILAQLRTALGLGAEGGADDALVLAVADWQATNGSGDPALLVDGKAGPRTLPRIFTSGLNVAGEGEAFGGEVQTEVVDQWSTLATPAARRDRLVELVNQRLVAAGVPAVTGAVDPVPVNSGSFDFEFWTMLIGDEALGGDEVTQDAAAEVADTVYHEARHTEQWFRMAQFRASQGLSARGIAAELGIPLAIARQAHGAPLVRGSVPALIAQGWWDSVYGGGADHRDRVLTEVEAAATARDAAEATLDADASPENQAAFDAATERFQRAHDAYRNLPEENDAWATGPAAAAGITRGSPPPTDSPAGTPPASGGPAHDVMPEENLR